MANINYKVFGLGLLVLCLIPFQRIQAQTAQPTLSDFFDKLKTIAPVKENLLYDTFPDFDFAKFEPLQESYGSKKVSYVVGTTRDRKMRTITFVNNDGAIGTMSIYDFQSFKIFTFKKKEVALGKYPDFPIFCVSNETRFIVYLNKPFEYQRMYKPDDIASVQILRRDLFPVYVLTIQDKYIRMLSDVNYIKDRSRIIDKVRNIVIFQPEKDKELLISDRSQFSEECYIPQADFIAVLHPKSNGEGMPNWLYSNGLVYE
jgi:hypothetical protein